MAAFLFRKHVSKVMPLKQSLVALESAYKIKTSSRCIINNLPGCCRQLHYQPNRKTKCQNTSLLLYRDTLLWKKTLSKKTYGGILSSSVISSRLASTESSSPATAVTDAISQASSAGTTPINYLPDAPPVPSPSEFLETLNALGEPTLASMGLGSWWPSGFVQMGLEQLHILGLPWWGAILTGTILIRICLIPLVIKAQKNAANMHNNMPTLGRLQNKFQEAKETGNTLEAAKAGYEMNDFMTRNNCNPMKSFLVPLAQMPIFVSVFFGIRGMANAPVASMKDGGLFWFTDLTLSDPFYLLPLVTSATLLLTFEAGVDGVRADSMAPGVRMFMRFMPVFIFPVMMKFPAALCCYWLTSNVFSLIQVLIMRIPSVRAKLGIPVLIAHPPESLPEKKKIRASLKDVWSNTKTMQRMEERQRMDAVRFKEAGQGPLQKTYLYDPTKVKKIQAKAK